jgi:hypothetical protein
VCEEGTFCFVSAFLGEGTFYVVSFCTSNWAYLSCNKVYLPGQRLELKQLVGAPSEGCWRYPLNRGLLRSTSTRCLRTSC